MSVRVIDPPEPIVMPEEIFGVDAGDEAVAGMIAAVTGEIDGPDGWLGRALGPQTLELRLTRWHCESIRLPCPPLIGVETISYIDQDGVEQMVDPSHWEFDDEQVWFLVGWAMPSLGNAPYPIRVRYRAGYDGDIVAEGGTGDVPPQAKQSIILSVQHMRAIGTENLFLRAEEVDGVGRTEYTVSEQAGNIIRQTSERLLSGLRKFI